MKDEIKREQYKNFIFTLNNFLANAIDEKELLDVMEDTYNNIPTMDNITDWSEWFHVFCDKTLKRFVTGMIPEWITQFKEAAESISNDDWNKKLVTLMKEMFKKYLLPKTKFQTNYENGRNVMVIQGNVVFLSKVLEEMKTERIQEIRIVGLISVHVDCDLDNETWHGINVGLITDKIFVDRQVTWNVSGLSWTPNSGWTRNTFSAWSSSEPKTEAGESGGNVHLICNEVIIAKQWTNIADGGDGSAHHKWTRDELDKAFPTMSLFDTGDKNKETVVTTLRKKFPREDWNQLLKNQSFDVCKESAQDHRIRMSFYKSKEKRQTLILFKGIVFLLDDQIK